MTQKAKLLDALQKFQAEVDARYLKEADLPQYSLTALATPTSGYLASYSLTKDGVNVGATINIPKDFLVRSATVETCTVADQPVAGYVVGDKYIDFVINTIGSDETAQHIYLLASDLAGTTVTIGQPSGTGNVVTALAIDANGVITPTMGITALVDADFEEVTAAEVAALWSSGGNTGGGA